MLAYHPVIGWTGRPHARIHPFPERLNSRGLRGPEFPDAKPAGAVRIVAMGDSCTFNIQLNDSGGPIPKVEIHDPYPADLNLLLAPLASPGRSYEVINAGVVGYTTLQGLRYLRREVFRWEPDVVLIKFGWNDHWVDETGGAGAEPRNAILRRLQWWLLQSRFHALLRRSIGAVALAVGAGEPRRDGESRRNGKETYRVPGGSPDPGRFRVPPEEFEWNMRLLVREARARGVTPIVMTAPMSTIKPTLLRDSRLGQLLQVTGYPNPREILAMHASYNGIAARVAREERARFIDLDREFAARGRGRFFGRTDIMHYNAEGNWLVAELVLGELQRLGIAPRRRAAAIPGVQRAARAAAPSFANTRSATSRATSR
jgi:lysophospholipase L1-like esterase